MRNIQICDSARKAFLWGFVLQVVLGILSALVFDGGYIVRVYCAALVAQLANSGWILYRRPTEPTRGDLLVLRFGIVPLFVVALLTAPWIAGWLQAITQ